MSLFSWVKCITELLRMTKFYNYPVLFTEIANNELKYDGVTVKYSDVKKILEPVAPSKVVNFWMDIC
ncbi:hypothetical protein GCM10020331_020570 [Ectobacillus funiculus]